MFVFWLHSSQYWEEEQEEEESQRRGGVGGTLWKSTILQRGEEESFDVGMRHNAIDWET